MVGGDYFWLGASAEAETGSRASTEPEDGLGPLGFDPARMRVAVDALCLRVAKHRLDEAVAGHRISNAKFPVRDVETLLSLIVGSER